MKWQREPGRQSKLAPMLDARAVMVAALAKFFSTLLVEQS
jgi:hypothetical protein